MTKHADLPEIYDRAEKLSIDIMAESYNLVFFSLAESRDTDTIDQEYSQRAADVQKQIDDTLQKEKNLYMFRNQTFSYVLLLTGDAENIQAHTEHCVKLLQGILEKDQSGLEWIVCASKPVERLSQMPDCYKEGMQLFAYRYFGYSHVISSDMVLGNNTEENELKDLVKNDNVDVVYCVPAIDIVPVVEATKGTNVAVGAENMYFEESGAYTGEISPNMLVDAGVKYVVLGHSERREYFAETDVTVNKKVLKAFEHGITPIICCGESLTQRKQGIYIDWIRMQIKIAFQNVTADQAKKAVIAYEPIWAIGTGKTATTEQAQEVCKAIRECIAEVYDEATAEAIRIQYGGSVNPATAPDLFVQNDIDGGLVGGASLKADFGKIVNYK